MTWLSIAFAGALGVLSRYGLSSYFSEHAGPWVTVSINIVGSFALGFVIGVGNTLPEPLRSSIAVGFLGGFTTFSTFSAQVVSDLAGGRITRAGMVIALSVFIGIFCAASGIRLGEFLHHSIS